MLLSVLLPRAAWAVDGAVWAELAKVQKLKASFEQVQTRAVLKVPLTSTGNVSYERGRNALVWQVDAPARSTFSLIGSVARMEYPDLGMNETIDLSQVPDASRLASSMLVWMQADAGAVARDFTVTYGADFAAMVPRDTTLKGLLSEIRIRFASAPSRVREVDLTEPDGDKVHIGFRSVSLDGVSVPDPS